MHICKKIVVRLFDIDVVIYCMYLHHCIFCCINLHLLENKNGLIFPCYCLFYFQLFCLIAYICVEVTNVICGLADATSNYFKFVTMGGFVVTLILWVFGLLKIPDRILRCDCIKWPFIVCILMYYAISYFVKIKLLLI